jgi:methionine synthase II (cobalamin-independent)
VNANDYAEQVVRKFMEDITDHVFLNIQYDESLMREYMTRVNENSLQIINQAIGKKVKEMFDLENIDVCSNPKSFLIKDYTRHRK